MTLRRRPRLDTEPGTWASRGPPPLRRGAWGLHLCRAAPHNGRGRTRHGGTSGVRRKARLRVLLVDGMAERAAFVGGTLTAHDTALECHLDTSAEGQLEGLKGAVERHLDRFAFREAPLQFAWS